jgi:hypothetical protein
MNTSIAVTETAIPVPGHTNQEIHVKVSVIITRPSKECCGKNWCSIHSGSEIELGSQFLITFLINKFC